MPIFFAAAFLVTHSHYFCGFPWHTVLIIFIVIMHMLLRVITYAISTLNPLLCSHRSCSLIELCSNRAAHWSCLLVQSTSDDGGGGVESAVGALIGDSHQRSSPCSFFALCQTVLLICVFSRPAKLPLSLPPPGREVVTSLLNNVCRGPAARGPFLTDAATGDTSEPPRTHARYTCNVQAQV